MKDKKTKQSFAPGLLVGLNLVRMAHEHGLIVRPVADSLAFCPPMVATEAEIDSMFDRFAPLDIRALMRAHIEILFGDKPSQRALS